MILTLEQIKTIILKRPNSGLVNRGIEYSKKLRRHIYGEGLKDHFKVIEGYEKPKVLELRKLYSRSNKDLFARLSRPIDKVFTAKGGSTYYNLSDAQEKQAIVYANNIRNGLSIRKWMEGFWKPHFLDDPYGFIFMEILPTQDAIRARQQGRTAVYPTYKSITDVYDYEPKGNRLEYVVFNLTAAQKEGLGLKADARAYRVVDDAFDYIILRQDGDVIVEMVNQTFPNYFMEVPGILNSDIIDPNHENGHLSLYDDIIELAEDFLLDGSIMRVHKFLHGFPKYAEMADSCPDCNGTTFVGAEPCKSCNGSGKKVMLSVSDVKLLEYPSKEEHYIRPGEVAAYISPDKQYHEMATSALLALENAMNVTLWGTSARIKSEGMSADASGEVKTATEVMDDIKPQSDRLIPISEMGELRHKFILDSCIRIQIQQSFSGTSVNYGRRYMMEGPDVIWEKYQNARTKGAPQNVLDTLLNEYYEANYQSDPVGLEVAKKLMYVEPFVHMNIANLKGLNVGDEDYKAKLYFSEWLATINEGMLLSSTVEELREQLLGYSTAKEIKEPAPAPRF